MPTAAYEWHRRRPTVTPLAARAPRRSDGSQAASVRISVSCRRDAAIGVTQYGSSSARAPAHDADVHGRRLGYASVMPAEFIYTTYRLARHYPPDKTVLEDISISFYPGAKIGVIGPNGAGKSSLLKIMAGLDDGFTGEARLTPGFSVGYLPQEPQLDATKTVKQNVLEGLGAVQR